MLADARPALLASAPDALVLADARPPALLALAPFALVRAEARPPTLLACAPDALVLADAHPPRTPCIGSFGAGAGRHCAASSSRRPPPRQLLRAPAVCRYASWLCRRNDPFCSDTTAESGWFP